MDVISFPEPLRRGLNVSDGEGPCACALLFVELGEVDLLRDALAVTAEVDGEDCEAALIEALCDALVIAPVAQIVVQER